MPINSPYHSSMEKEIIKATKIVDSFFGSTVSADGAIPTELLRKCSGVAFLTVIKGGFVWTGKIGTGVVISKLPDGSWSPPSGIGTAGVGFGAEIGGELVDFLIILGSPSAVRTFKKGTQVSVGAGLDITMGPVGRTAAASVNASGGGFSANYSYSHSKGAYAGIGLHGSTIMIRGDMNHRFYGSEVSPMQILSGDVQPPAGSCDMLYEAINRALSHEQNMHQPALEGPSYASQTYGSYHSREERASVLQSASRSSMNASVPYDHQRSSSSSSSSIPPPTTVEADPNDPRLRRFSNYKSEKELYEQFAQQKNGGSKQEYKHTNPNAPAVQYEARPAPDASRPPRPSTSSSSSFSAPKQEAPPVPSQATGSEMKQVYMQVIKFIKTQCPHADVQKFKDNCRLFGQDQMSLDAYFTYLNSICSQQHLKELCPQLVRLLPTADKRERLWQKYVSDVLLLRV